MRQSRVFVCQDLGFDYSDAEQFGELVVLVSKNQSAENIARVRQQIRKMFWDYKISGSDFLLCSGSPVVLMIAAIEASRVAGLPLKVLHWDRQESHYRLSEI